MQAKQRILTLPNVMSFIRLGMIPAIACLYSRRKRASAAVMLVLSGLTDIADGYIARRFNLVTDLGKVLDPIADKLTQAVILFFLIADNPPMLFPFVLLVIKETVMAVCGLLAIRRTGVVNGADWHGKVATALLYFTMFLHVAMQDIPAALSNLLIVACIVMMLISLFLYTQRNIRAYKATGMKGD